MDIRTLKVIFENEHKIFFLKGNFYRSGSTIALTPSISLRINVMLSILAFLGSLGAAILKRHNHKTLADKKQISFL